MVLAILYCPDCVSIFTTKFLLHLIYKTGRNVLEKWLAKFVQKKYFIRKKSKNRFFKAFHGI